MLFLDEIKKEPFQRYVREALLLFYSYFCNISIIFAYFILSLAISPFLELLLIICSVIVLKGYSDDDIIEVIEYEGKGFNIGVQWHPEFILDRAEQNKIFKTFVDYIRTM